ncbi:MAG: ABC transporter permease subunit [Clostridiales bacterium]|uniref:ABC transporter permease subunit n=1 Tax=Clostridium sp. N3C TaxID=1776758 RepID=UPI00092E0F96|nr:ABC transporter permease subunit [Clostridium sp. N3C]NLZ47677.1 ABC transporter permease subunit [Clostridiales bacterium]SCN22855.1 ABC-type transport system involved in multi-copper enzyme maturation, permease component [Clostridium sp. N3C]
MSRLIKAEIYTLFKTRAFKILCIIALLCSLMLIGITKLVSSEQFLKNNLKGMTEEQQEQFIEELKNASSNNSSPVNSSSSMGFTINASDLFNPTARELFKGTFGNRVIEIFLAILIGVMVAAEYSSGTIKNKLAYGKRREQYYLAKIIASTVGMIILLAIMVSIATIGSTILFGWGKAFDLHELAYILGTFCSAIIVGMAIISLMTLIATLVKSNGATIGIGIVVFALLPSIVAFLYGKYDWFDKIFETTPAYNWSVITSLVSSNSDIIKSVVISLVTLVVASILGIMVFKKQDIK